MLITIAAPTTFPVTVAEASDHCRAPDNGDDNALVLRALKAAIDYVQRETNLILAPTTLQYRIDAWPCGGLILPKAPVRDVRAISYLDADGNEQTVADDQYYWDPVPEGAVVRFGDLFSAPALQPRRSGGVRIEFDAGFDDPGASASGDDPNLILPETLKIAVLMLTQHWYDNRGVVSFEPSHAVVLSAMSLLAQQRIYR